MTGPDQNRAALGVREVSKHYGRARALDRVTLDIRPGEVHGLLGGNGSGKSTLIKILAGVVPADPGGRLQVDGEVRSLDAWSPARAHAAGFRFVHQNLGIFPGLSVAENLAVGHGFERHRSGRVAWSAQRRHARQVLDRFRIDVSPTTEIGRLGPATRTMIAIARSLQDLGDRRDGVLVLDEPTAALPRSEVELLLEAVQGYARAGQTIVLVTHRLDEVIDTAQHVSVLRDGANIGTHACAGMTRRDLARLIVGHDVVTSAGAGPRVADAQPSLLSVRGLVAGPLRGVDLDVPAGRIIGVAGLLGSGRSTLLRSIFGAVVPDHGDIVLDGSRLRLRSPREAVAKGIAYVPEDRKTSAAFGNLTVRENLSAVHTASYWRRIRFDHRAESADARAAISRFGVKCDGPESLISSLSGGNQQKTVLARWLQLRPRLLLLDEPTQGVDVGARADIFRLVREGVAGGTSVLMVSSDFEELVEVCDEIAVLSAGAIVQTISASGAAADRLLESALNGVHAL